MGSISSGNICVVVVVVVAIIQGMGVCEDPGRQWSSLLVSCRMEVTSLLPCTTFVQGTTPEPTESCCDNLGDIYRQQPQCLCTFLNTSFNSFVFPINRTLMLKLPAVCNLLTDDHPSSSACKMVSFREAKKNSTRRGEGENNATVAASPMMTHQVAPPGFMMHSHSPTPNLLLLVAVRSNFLLSALLLYCFQL